MNRNTATTHIFLFHSISLTQTHRSTTMQTAKMKFIFKAALFHKHTQPLTSAFNATCDKTKTCRKELHIFTRKQIQTHCCPNGRTATFNQNMATARSRKSSMLLKVLNSAIFHSPELYSTYSGSIRWAIFSGTLQDFLIRSSSTNILKQTA